MKYLLTFLTTLCLCFFAHAHDGVSVSEADTVFHNNTLKNNANLRVFGKTEIGVGDSTVLSVHHLSNKKSRTETVMIPDALFCPNVGDFYRDSVVFSNFTDTDVIQSVEDILSVCVNMEHSYFSEVRITLECPNGQRVHLLPNFPSGWPTAGLHDCFLGKSYYPSEHNCDVQDPENAPGIGWNYCWSNTEHQGYTYASGPNGYIYEAENLVPNNNIDSTNTATMSQVYHPVQSFENLIGCPMNGTWFLEVEDTYSGDNGYIFGWDITLAESHATPAFTQVTCEGLYINSISMIDSIWNIVIKTPSDVFCGTYLYEITATDEMGSSFTDNIQVTVSAHSDTLLFEKICMGDTFDFFGQQLTESGVYSHLLSSAINGCDSTVYLCLTTHLLEPSLQNDTSELILQHGESTTLHFEYDLYSHTIAVSDTMFIPDSYGCPFGSTAQAPITFINFSDTDVIESVEDILSVCINMEHSFLGDLKIALECPNGTRVHLLPENSEWPTSGFKNTWLGVAIDDVGGGCNGDVYEKGFGWNYCWSNNTDQGYTYASGLNGYIYEESNIILYNITESVVDSTDKTTMSQVYHPVESFESFVGCPMNGTWLIEIEDTRGIDNGFVFEWEISLKDKLPVMLESYEGSFIDSITTTSNGIDIVITPPENAICDTYNYAFSFTNNVGCDTTITLQMSLNSLQEVFQSAQICENETYLFFDQLLSENGNYSHLAQNTFNCDSMVHLLLTVHDLPTVTISGATTIVEGSSTVLTASSDSDEVQWLWSTGETTSSITVAPSVSTTYHVVCTDTNQCQNSDSILVTVLLSVENLDNSVLKMYPNPANNTITVEGVEVAEITIYNITGTLMQKAENQNVIDVSSYGKGTYILKILDKNGHLYIRKAVIQ